MKVIITERGWPGHFCASSSCQFRRNTLIEYGDKRIVVSTVGNYIPRTTGEIKKIDREIGLDRTYETMAFWARYEKPYWEADVSKEVDFESDWAIGELEFDTDKKANDMHERVVEELSKLLTNPTYQPDITKE
jgi:hypothetical protein